MKSLFSLLLFMLVSYPPAQAQKTTNHTSRIKQQANKMGQFFIREEFDSFATYTYSKLIDLMGGKQAFINELTNGTQSLKKGGGEFLTVSFGEPSKVVASGRELQCTIPQILTFHTGKGNDTVTLVSTLIAISGDDGKNWLFIDASNKDLKTLRKVVPTLSAKLIIPTPQQPIHSTYKK